MCKNEDYIKASKHPFLPNILSILQPEQQSTFVSIPKTNPKIQSQCEKPLSTRDGNFIDNTETYFKQQQQQQSSEAFSEACQQIRDDFHFSRWTVAVFCFECKQTLTVALLVSKHARAFNNNRSQKKNTKKIYYIIYLYIVGDSGLGLRGFANHFDKKPPNKKK